MKINLLLIKIVLLSTLTFHMTTWAAKAHDPGLSISVAVPVHLENRTIDLLAPNAHFHVLISNTSKIDLNLWREWCSWGYFNLSFEIIDDKGKSWIVKKRDRPWSKNFPDFATLASNQSLVLDVNFNPKIWLNLPPSSKSKSQIISMRVIYNSSESDQSKKLKIWSGKITSPSQEFIIKY